MNTNNSRGHLALTLAVASAALFGARNVSAATGTFTGSISTNNTSTPSAVAQSLIESGGPFATTARLSLEGATEGGTTFASFDVLDFNAGQIFGNGNVGLPALTQVTSISSIGLTLTDLDESFAVAGKVDVFLTNNTGSLSALTYQTAPASQPSGIGNQLDTLFSAGSFSYVATAGTVYNTTLTLSSAAQSYLVGQLNTGNDVRLVLAVESPNTAADFNSVAATTSSLAPSLNLALNTSTFTAANSTLTVNGGTKSQTVVFPRVVVGATATQNITLTNSGTDAGSYSVSPAAADPNNPLSVAGAGSAGTNPLPGGNGTTSVSVGLRSTTAFIGGLASAANPATASVTIHDNSNPTNDGDITITVQANQVVANRLVNNVGGSACGTNFAASGTIGVLGGTSVTLPVTFTTTNSNATIIDKTSNSLTTLEILGSAATAPVKLSSTDTGVTDMASIAADPNNANVTFGSTTDPTDPGTETATRMVTFSPTTAVGGLYANVGFFDGFVALPMVQLDSAVGASTTVTARDNITTNVYQPASVSSTASGSTVTLTNAPHTVNNAGTAHPDIGARASAQVTSVSMTAQAGWTVDPALVTGATIGDGQTVNGAAFSSGGKLNGTYTGTLAVGLQNEQDLTGAAPNDLGTKNFTLTTSVTGNSGNGTANILSNGSLAGYNINRGTGKNSTISFLAGTSTSGGNISVNWADGVNTTASDKATVGNTASSLYVLQMSYDSTAITNGASSPTLASDIGNKFIGAVNGDGAVNPVEINGAFDNNLVLGHYGIDTTNHVVWAVVNYAGDFQVTQRLLGDSNGDGKVDLTDLSTVLNNFGSTTALWSTGNFDGASTIDLTDLSDVLNNFGSSVPNASVGGVATPALSEVPEPASLGLLSVGLLPLLKRRRR